MNHKKSESPKFTSLEITLKKLKITNESEKSLQKPHHSIKRRVRLLTFFSNNDYKIVHVHPDLIAKPHPRVHDFATAHLVLCIG